MKIILKLLLAFVCVVTVLVAYEVYFPWEDKARERTFHQRLEEKVAAGETKIYLRDLTDFEWDRACYVTAYREDEFTNNIIDLTSNFPNYLPWSCFWDGCYSLLFSYGASGVHTIIGLNPKSVVAPACVEGGESCCFNNAIVTVAEQSLGGKFYKRYELSGDKRD